jgi:hypothetical protein
VDVSCTPAQVLKEELLPYTRHAISDPEEIILTEKVCLNNPRIKEEIALLGLPEGSKVVIDPHVSPELHDRCSLHPDGLLLQKKASIHQSGHTSSVLLSRIVFELTYYNSATSSFKLSRTTTQTILLTRWTSTAMWTPRSFV